MSAQPVDATPSNQLVRQPFPIENPTVRLSIKPSQGGNPDESRLGPIPALKTAVSSRQASVASTH
jgi:hypothetical protein